ncbi:MAG: carboxypeptidase-like regulatory domain-containing protein [Bacteroidaceae bacterium]|nr:carboxypeptidase-like regulatory domain-containing protein [Bacteroidaceae bacterium]
MKRLLFAFLLLVATSIAAQDIRVKGRIVSEEGTAVEYATIGIPGTKNGTLSGIDGEFELTLPQECNDTIVASHVSYGDVKIPVVLYRNCRESLIVTMQPKQLQELTVYDGKRKKARLSNRGMKVAGGVTQWTTEKLGYEIGSIINVKRVFEVEELLFSTVLNKIENARLSINIYLMDESESNFSNVMHHPIYVDIPVSEKKNEHVIAVKENIFLEAGRYYVAVKFVDGVTWTKSRIIRVEKTLSGQKVG